MHNIFMPDEFHPGDYVLYDDPESGETKFGIITSIRGSRGTIAPVTRIDNESIPEQLPGKPVKFLTIRSVKPHDHGGTLEFLRSA
jgi:hypothetical protein